MRKIIPIVVLVGGVVLVIFGFDAMNGIGQSVWMLVSGVIAVTIGLTFTLRFAN